MSGLHLGAGGACCEIPLSRARSCCNVDVLSVIGVIRFLIRGARGIGGISKLGGHIGGGGVLVCVDGGDIMSVVISTAVNDGILKLAKNNRELYADPKGRKGQAAAAKRGA